MDQEKLTLKEELRKIFAGETQPLDKSAEIPVGENEEVIGVVTDPIFKCLFETSRRKFDEGALLLDFYAEESSTSEVMAERDKRLHTIREQVEVLRGLIGVFIQEEFNPNLLNCTLALRENWQVVKLVDGECDCTVCRGEAQPVSVGYEIPTLIIFR